MRTRFLIKGIKHDRLYELHVTEEYRRGITEDLIARYTDKGYSEVSVFVRNRDRYSESIEGKYLKEYSEYPKEEAIKRAAQVNGHIEETQKHTYKGPLMEYIVNYYIPCKI